MKPAVTYRGRGPRLYAHPGGPGLSSAEFLPDFGGLERAFEVAYVDPRGTGATPKPIDPRAYALDDYANDLAELIDEPSIVLGFSHGGLVAQRFAGRYPDKVSGLILASTAARFSSDVDAALARKVETSKGERWLPDALDALSQEQSGEYKDDADLARVLARELPLYFHRFDARAAKWIDLIADHACNADALRYFNEVEFMSIDLRAELPKIKARTIVVSGESDFVCPPDAGRELQDGIEGSALTIIPRSGHMTYVEQPEAFYEAVVALLK
ncbi:MAG TPA: alpha/beta fold hydrolase [Candidatus Eremiobacteraceae bacterium]|nr:alpha/beta fold hydrolase [Candidatus Eremiobacteraceae bacterium]